jgi:hypothetical protein
MKRHTIVLLLVCGAACSSSPTGPEPVPAGYAGEWVGTTGHGTPISFSVSVEQVTSFRFTFNLSSTCFGTETILGPAPIVMQVPPGPPPFDQPGFVISRVESDFVWGAAAAGAFAQDRRSASGQFQLVHYPGCDQAILGSWSASRR